MCPFLATIPVGNEYPVIITGCRPKSTYILCIVSLFHFSVPNRLSFVSAAVIEAALAAFRGKVDPDHLGIILWPQFEAQAKVIPFTQRAQQG